MRRPGLLDAEFAALSQQVSSLETDYRDIKVAVVNLDKKIDASFTALSNKIDARAYTPWMPIFGGGALFLSLVSMIGFLAMQPLKEGLAEARAMMTKEQQVRADRDIQVQQRITALGRDLDRLIGRQEH